MINKEVEGNLIRMALNCEFDAIIHGANCFNTMGKGIANTIRKVFPEAYNIDKSTKKGDVKKLGNYTYATVKLQTCYVQIINAYTQYDYRITYKNPINVDYEAIKKVFSKINNDFKEMNWKFGIPKIGAGLAGGNWEKIKAIINEVTQDIDITLVNYGEKEND